MDTVSVEQFVALIPDGASLMIGGFMGGGTHERVVDEIGRQKKSVLMVIANDTARGVVGAIANRPAPPCQATW